MSSTSSAESAVSVSDSNEPECEPSHSARSTPRPAKSLRSTGQASPVMKTSEVSPLNASPQMALPLMLSAEAFPARTSALLAQELGLTERVPAYGLSTPELLARLDQDTSSWRTSQRCLVEGWTEFSETWPRSGMMRSGIAYQLPPLALGTDETASGLWPTPLAQDGKQSGLAPSGTGQTLKLSFAVQQFPTPTARDYRSGSRSAEGWQKRLDHTRGWQLNDVVARFPTPTANRRSGLQSHGVNVIHGLLNPLWVEWLMGFPAEWTALSSSATPSSRKSRKSSAEQS